MRRPGLRRSEPLGDAAGYHSHTANDAGMQKLTTADAFFFG